MRLERLESGTGSEEVWTQVEMFSLTPGHWTGCFSPVWESGEYRVREVSGESSQATIHAKTDADGDGSDPILMTERRNYPRNMLYFDVKYEENGGKTVITNTQRSPFSVRKEWDIPAENQKPTSIQVILMKWHPVDDDHDHGGWDIVEGPKVLNAANGWKADFTAIPNVSGDYWDNYAIRELDKDGNVVIDKNRTDDKESEERYNMPDGRGRRTSAAYTVGTGVSEYEVTYTLDWNGMVAITNAQKAVPLTAIKVWGTGEDGKTMKAESVRVVLQHYQKKDNSSEYEWKTESEAVELNEANEWQHTFATQQAGVKNYRIRELNESGDIIYDQDDADKPEGAGNTAVFPVREGTKSVGIPFKVEYTVDADGVTTVTNTHTPVPEPKTYTITYVLNGGVYAGSRSDIRETYTEGTAISIHAAPIRSGYHFLYWQGSVYYPGESYTVTGNHTFTAQWERTNEPPDSARTGDNSRLGLWTLLMLLSLSCLAFIPGMHRKKDSH